MYRVIQTRAQWSRNSNTCAIVLQQQPCTQLRGEQLDIRSLFKLFRAVAHHGGYRNVTLVKCAHPLARGCMGRRPGFQCRLCAAQVPCQLVVSFIMMLHSFPFRCS